MRRQLALVVAGTTSLILLAFLLPLALLVRTVAQDRALDVAAVESDSLLPVLGSVADPRVVGLTVDRLNAASPSSFTVYLPDGQVFGAPATEGRELALARQGVAFSTDVRNGRELLQPVQLPGGVAVVRAFVPTAVLRRGLPRAYLILGLLGLGLAVVTLLVADRLARSVVRPIAEVAAAARQLEAGRLDTRVEPQGPPEVREVATALNRLAARIRELLIAERESVADLSHRLRTPVTALRLDGEGLRDPAEAARISADVDALERTVDRLIHEARRPLRDDLAAERSDAAAVVRNRVEFWQVLAEDQRRRVQVAIPDVALPVAVSAEDLAAAVDALLGNVFAHTPEGVGFTVAVRPALEGVQLVVEDAGAGLSDPALLGRGRSGAGSTGLGLDIVRRTAESSGGRFQLGAAALGGARAEVLLGVPPPQ